MNVSPPSAMAASLYGMRDATRRFDRASNDLIQAVSGVSSASPEVAIVEQIEAETQFKASARTMRTADEMLGTLIDIIA
jgi:hypothetical protein